MSSILHPKMQWDACVQWCKRSRSHSNPHFEGMSTGIFSIRCACKASQAYMRLVSSLSDRELDPSHIQAIAGPRPQPHTGYCRQARSFAHTISATNDGIVAELTVQSCNLTAWTLTSALNSAFNFQASASLMHWNTSVASDLSLEVRPSPETRPAG